MPAMSRLIFEAMSAIGGEQTAQTIYDHVKQLEPSANALTVISTIPRFAANAEGSHFLKRRTKKWKPEKDFLWLVEGTNKYKLLNPAEHVDFFNMHGIALGDVVVGQVKDENPEKRFVPEVPIHSALPSGHESCDAPEGTHEVHEANSRDACPAWVVAEMALSEQKNTAEENQVTSAAEIFHPAHSLLMDRLKRHEGNLTPLPQRSAGCCSESGVESLLQDPNGNVVILRVLEAVTEETFLDLASQVGRVKRTLATEGEVRLVAVIPDSSLDQDFLWECKGYERIKVYSLDLRERCP